MENFDSKKIGVRILKAHKKGRIVTIQFESDLYSNEPFAVEPYYDEGEDKDQLQNVKFVLHVTEENNCLKTDICISGDHYTKGHTQLFDVTNRFKDKYWCVVNWIATCDEGKLLSHCKRVIERFRDDPATTSNLWGLVEQRKKEFKKLKIEAVNKKCSEALEQIGQAMKELSSFNTTEGE